MTIEEKFGRGIVLEEKDGDYVLELWGASTKHPDTVFYFSNWKDKSEYIEPKYQVMQWLFHCASKLTWPFHAQALAEYSLREWANWNE